MVVKIPKGVYKMTEKKKIVKENLRMYWRSSKKKKGQILDRHLSRKLCMRLNNSERKTSLKSVN